MKNKKLLSLALAGLMALSLAVPAFAADPNSTVISGAYKDVVIDVVVPATGAAFINPYGLDLKVKEDITNSSSNEVTISGQQIVSAPMALKNKTAMDLNVSATVTGTITPLPESATSSVLMKFNANTTKGVGTNPEAEGYVAPATGKAAFVYLQAKQEPALTGADAAVDATAIAAKYAAWTASAYDENKDVVVATKAATKDNIVVLRAAAMDNSDAFASYKAGSIALFRLTGDCTSGPKAGWTEDDKFTVTVAFSFTPAEITKYAVTIGTITGGTVTADVTQAAEGDEVTLTATPSTAGQTATYTVKKAGGTDTVTVTNGKFTMPAYAVEVTATFA